MVIYIVLLVIWYFKYNAKSNLKQKSTVQLFIHKQLLSYSPPAWWLHYTQPCAMHSRSSADPGGSQHWGSGTPAWLSGAGSNAVAHPHTQTLWSPGTWSGALPILMPAPPNRGCLAAMVSTDYYQIEKHINGTPYIQYWWVQKNLICVYGQK